MVTFSANCTTGDGSSAFAAAFLPLTARPNFPTHDFGPCPPALEPEVLFSSVDGRPEVSDVESEPEDDDRTALAVAPVMSRSALRRNAVRGVLRGRTRGAEELMVDGEQASPCVEEEVRVAVGILEAKAFACARGAGAAIFALNASAFSFSLRFAWLVVASSKSFASDPFLRRLILLGVLRRRLRNDVAWLSVRERCLSHVLSLVLEASLGSTLESPVEAENFEGGSVGTGR